MTRNKWYNRWWIKYVVFVIILIVFYVLVRNTINETTISKHLKQKNEELLQDSKNKDKLIDSLVVQKNKVKIIREKISTKEQEARLQELRQQLVELRKQKVEANSIETIKAIPPTPEELTKFLQDIIK